MSKRMCRLAVAWGMDSANKKADVEPAVTSLCFYSCAQNLGFFTQVWGNICISHLFIFLLPFTCAQTTSQHQESCDKRSHPHPQSHIKLHQLAGKIWKMCFFKASFWENREKGDSIELLGILRKDQLWSVECWALQIEFFSLQWNRGEGDWFPWRREGLDADGPLHKQREQCGFCPPALGATSWGWPAPAPSQACPGCHLWCIYVKLPAPVVD